MEAALTNEPDSEELKKLKTDLEVNKFIAQTCWKSIFFLQEVVKLTEDLVKIAPEVCVCVYVCVCMYILLYCVIDQVSE